jgi:hypothetical protein
MAVFLKPAENNVILNPLKKIQMPKKIQREKTKLNIEHFESQGKKQVKPFE